MEYKLYFEIDAKVSSGNQIFFKTTFLFIIKV